MEPLHLLVEYDQNEIQHDFSGLLAPVQVLQDATHQVKTIEISCNIGNFMPFALTSPTMPTTTMSPLHSLL